MTVPVPPTGAPTVSHMLGEMTWLLSQSPLHRVFTIGDLEWMVMPALLGEQFYLFRDGDRPVGLALWAKTNATGEAKLQRGMVDPQNRLTLDEWSGGDRWWLVDLVAPFANGENRQREIMVADLISGPLRGQAFKLHVTDPQTGERRVQAIGSEAGDKLKEAIESAMAGG